MARVRSSELIMVVTAMNNELIMTQDRASELIMAITAMSNVKHIKKHSYYLIC